MPRENSSTRRSAAEVRSTSSSTSSILDWLTSPRIAWMRRWFRALRPGWASEASRTAPTTCSGLSSSWYGRPLMVALPSVGVVRPSSMRRVVVFPASAVAALTEFLLRPQHDRLSSRDSESLATIARMITASPALLARERQVFAEHTAELAAVLAEQTHAD